MLGALELAAMKSDAWGVNVTRGSLIDTDALVQASAAGRIGEASLDVTDPDPLSEGYPLWSEPRALIAPHTAPPNTLADALAER
jgi:D-3-phosphoglycerate dehydrogenase